MAKRNKSKAIRQVVAEKPAASVKEIQAALKRLKVSPALIHQVRGKKTNGQATFDQLLAAKTFVAKMGSVEAAREALNSYGKLI